MADALPLLAGMAPFGVVVGIAASLHGLAGPVALGASGVLFAGTAQMAGFAQVAAGSGPLAVVITMVIVNARILLYGAALEPWFRQQPRWFRWLAPFLIVDQTYATAIHKAPVQPDRFRRYWLALGLLVAANWTASIGVGMVVGPALPDGLPLGAAGTACMAGLLVPRLTDAPARVAAIAAAVVGFLGATLPAGMGILVATLAGMSLGVWLTRGDPS